MTALQVAMGTLIAVFDQYAAPEGKKDTLTKNEVKTLLQKELPDLLKTAKNQEEADKLIEGLDLDGDSEVDFCEFVVVVATLACACYGHYFKK